MKQKGGTPCTGAAFVVCSVIVNFGAAILLSLCSITVLAYIAIALFYYIARLYCPYLPHLSSRA